MTADSPLVLKKMLKIFQLLVFSTTGENLNLLPLMTMDIWNNIGQYNHQIIGILNIDAQNIKMVTSYTGQGYYSVDGR